MGPRLKNKVRASVKTTKKPRTRKSSTHANTSSDTCKDRKGNKSHQTLHKNSPPREEVNTIVPKEENSKRGKRDRSADPDKPKRKSARVKAENNISSQRAISRDKKELPSSAFNQGWAKKASDTVNESENQDDQRTYEVEQRKTNSKKSPMNGSERKRKSRSPSKEMNSLNKKAETELHSEAGNKNSQTPRNNFPGQKEQKRSRNESLEEHCHDRNERCPSDSQGKDSHTESQMADKVSHKRSPSSSAANMHRSSSRSHQITSLKNKSQELQPGDNGSSVATRGDSPESSHNRDSEQVTEKKISAETSTKPGPLGFVLENSSAQTDSSGVERKTIGSKSPKLRHTLPKRRRHSSKTSKRPKTEVGMKKHQRNKKMLLEKNNGTVSEAKSKGKRRKNSKKMKKKPHKSTTTKKS